MGSDGTRLLFLYPTHFQNPIIPYKLHHKTKINNKGYLQQFSTYFSMIVQMEEGLTEKYMTAQKALQKSGDGDNKN